MDHVIALIVRIISALAGYARLLPNFMCAPYQPGEKVRILLAGYNGARNTGSDVRVSSLADQIIKALGPENVELSVMSLDTESTAPYFEGKATQIPFNTIFFMPLLKACSQNHIAILCEGSTFKSKFADALTLYSCEAAGVMRAQEKLCIAYGGEVGYMEPYLERTVRDLCSDVVFIARSGQSCDAAQALGLKAMRGTDTAWTFDSAKGDELACTLLGEGGWDGKQPLLGLAPINPFMWPAKPSIAKWIATALGDKRFMQYQKWYFLSWSEERKRKYERYLDEFAAAAKTFVNERGFMPVIIGMEKLDEDACNKLNERMGGTAPVVLSKNRDGFTIGSILRSLSLLVTSRYHAQVLATGASVPAVAVSMDERLDNLASELEMPSDLLLHVDQDSLGARILVALDFAQENREAIAAKLAERRMQLVGQVEEMASWFKGLEQQALCLP